MPHQSRIDLSRFAVKVTTYPGDIGELAKKYSGCFEIVPVGRTDIKKHAAFKEQEGKTYLVIISQSHGINPNYNVILSVQGPEQRVIDGIMCDLTSRLEVSAREAPRELTGLFSAQAEVFRRLPH